MAGEDLETRWNVQLVLFSYFAAVFGSASCILFVDEAVRSTSQRRSMLLLVGASLVFGVCGVWSMHFLGMAALEIGDRKVTFDPLLTTLSAFAPLAFVFPSLYITLVGLNNHRRLDAAGRARSQSVVRPMRRGASSSRMTATVASMHTTLRNVVANAPYMAGGAVMLGSGVGVMHYTGMAAIEVEGARLIFNPVFIVLCVLVAVAVSFIGLSIVFFVPYAFLRFAASFVVGGAVCCAHYTGMMGVTYRSIRAIPYSATADLEHTNDALRLSLVVIIVFSCIRFLAESVLHYLVVREREDQDLALERLLALAKDTRSADASSPMNRSRAPSGADQLPTPGGGVGTRRSVAMELGEM
ncbi:uncharacterized protein AMSG_00491 [Thecamonas trahens ATCC 50062]|uniref:MHYT domain-containing protein n=1 Tax=Thecamonas trahens ATCC 50062 TaxID=461836 RepID=A0A0L0D9I0_THETB|nr:hypothetical protein AMSG_00491 [Thecamonas trahens ATCC 50062]KNC48716.1 hypothetical protein AMSG_00491 [Thecamonas trahens ATCC 50062]|eukprot:XP_013762768.1 hypothetical protein AMSG_00491 [Thecamonas trahens ATCC 50062]